MENQIEIMKQTNALLVAKNQEQTKLIRNLSTELALIQNETGKKFEDELVTKQVNKIHALEDAYRCLKNEYLPFLVSHGKGKEMVTLIRVIDSGL